jgi:signal transduction histidine kinase
VSSLSSGDYIRRIHAGGDEVFFTTTNGKLYRLNAQSSLAYVLSIPKPAGIIEQIAAIGPNQFVLAASGGMYLYNNKTRQLRLLNPLLNVKDLAVHDGTVYLACNMGIRAFTLKQVASAQIAYLLRGNIFNKFNRCKSVAFAGDSCIAAFTDGLYIAYQNNIRPVLYNNRPIYASKVRVMAGKMVVGTYNQGLLIFEKGTVRNLTENDGLASNNIKDIKVLGQRAWIAYNDDVQQLNPTLTGIVNTAFYFPKAAGINDISMWGDRLYVASNEGIYSMNIDASMPHTSVATHIDKVTVNGKVQPLEKKLAYFENHLQFQVSTPFYSPHSKIVYQYRIKNTSDSTWQSGALGQTTFDVVALEPGVYTFEIVATDKSRNVISWPAVYRFEIVPPWYQTWTFRIIAGMVITALGLYFIWVYYKVRLRRQRVEYEKILAVQAERQRISSEIHDDIGAGLSAIRLLTEITKNKLPESEAQKEVSKIHASISELSQKMREVIWSLNTDNDRLENLLFYIQRQANLLFENSPIRLKVSFPIEKIPNVVIKGEKRRHIYLAAKEALHNCLKHSEAQTCYLSMNIEGDQLRLSIVDDGKGFLPGEKWQAGSGLTSMQRRMQQIGGYFEVQSKGKTEVRFTIPLNDKS